MQRATKRQRLERQLFSTLVDDGRDRERGIFSTLYALRGTASRDAKRRKILQETPTLLDFTWGDPWVMQDWSGNMASVLVPLLRNFLGQTIRIIVTNGSPRGQPRDAEDMDETVAYDLRYEVPARMGELKRVFDSTYVWDWTYGFQQSNDNMPIIGGTRVRIYTASRVLSVAPGAAGKGLLHPSYMQQWFAQNGFCLLAPIERWASGLLESAVANNAANKTQKNAKTRLNKVHAWKQRFATGVPEDGLWALCDDLCISIFIDTPLAKGSPFVCAKSQKESKKTFHFRFTRRDHVEEVQHEAKTIKMFTRVSAPKRSMHTMKAQMKNLEAKQERIQSRLKNAERRLTNPAREKVVHNEKPDRRPAVPSQEVTHLVDTRKGTADGRWESFEPSLCHDAIPGTRLVQPTLGDEPMPQALCLECADDRIKGKDKLSRIRSELQDVVAGIASLQAEIESCVGDEVDCKAFLTLKHSKEKNGATQDELEEMMQTMLEDGKHFTFKRSKCGVTQVSTLTDVYSTHDLFGETVKVFEEKTRIRDLEIDATRCPLLVRFLYAGTRNNSSTQIRVVPEGADPSLFGCIDVHKCYATFDTCAFYEGFPHKITDLRPTKEVFGIGKYLVDTITIPDLKLDELNCMLGNLYRAGQIYTSADLRFLAALGCEYTVSHGCWSPTSFDFRFTGSAADKTGMFQKQSDGEEKGVSFYAKWVGMCARRLESLEKESFWMISDEREYLETIATTCGTDVDIRYFEDGGQTQITYPRKHQWTMPHVFEFINAYERIRIISQLMKMDTSKIYRVTKDDILFEKHEFEKDDCFNWKEPKLAPIGGSEYLPNPMTDLEREDLVSQLDKIQTRPFNRVEAHIAPGGHAKTHTQLVDAGLQNVCYLGHSWALTRKKQKEYEQEWGVQVGGEVHWCLLGAAEEDHPRHANLLKKYSTLIIDECSVLTSERAMLMMQNAPNHRIIFCGDPDCQVQPVVVGGEAWHKFCPMRLRVPCFTDYPKNYRCQDPELLDDLTEMRRMIQSGCKIEQMKEFATRRLKQKSRLVRSVQDVVDMYKVSDLVLVARRTDKSEQMAAWNEVLHEAMHPTVSAELGLSTFKRVIEDAVYFDTRVRVTLSVAKITKWVCNKTDRKYANGEIVVSGTQPSNTDAHCQHAFTIHQIQGETAQEKLFIDARYIFQPEMWYTAFSRAKRWDQIYGIDPPPDDRLIVKYNDKRYSRCKIYRISSPNTHLVYIGHTIDELEARFASHKKDKKCASREVIRAGGAVIELVEAYPCPCKDAANARELYWIEMTPNCVNVQIPGGGNEKRAYEAITHCPIDETELRDMLLKESGDRLTYLQKLKQRLVNGCLPEFYSRPNKVDRLYAGRGERPISVHGMWKDMRPRLCKGSNPFDMVNAIPSLTVLMCHRLCVLGVICSEDYAPLQDYCVNRDTWRTAIMQHHGCDLEQAKNLLLVSLYGGDPAHHLRDVDTNKDNLVPLLSQFRDKFATLRDKVLRYYLGEGDPPHISNSSTYVGVYNKKLKSKGSVDKARRSMFAIITQELEAKALDLIRDVCVRHKIRVHSLIFDGILIDKSVDGGWFIQTVQEEAAKLGTPFRLNEKW